MNRYLAGAVLMSALVLVYLGFAVVYASILLRDDSLLVKAMGAALLVLPVLGAWGMVAEWRFGVASARLTSLLDREGALADVEFPTSASGRPLRDHAMSVFPAFQADVEAHPTSWQAWFRLGRAYDACGDRRRARWAVRRAIRLERGQGE